MYMYKLSKYVHDKMLQMCSEYFESYHIEIDVVVNESLSSSLLLLVVF